MNYNTETISAIAEQVSSLLKMTLEQQQAQNESGSMNIAAVEMEMRKLLREVGAQALSQFLSSGSGTPVAELACECGGTLRYQRKRAAVITSVFGKVRYARAYYAGCVCGEGKAPVDEAYGLEPGAMSSGLAALMGLAGIEFGFEQSCAWLERFLLFEVSENSVRAETHTLGQLQTQREALTCQHSQDAAQLQARSREPTPGVTRLYGSLDAAKVRIEPRPRAGQKVEAQEDWRDMKVGCWYEAEPVPAAQRSTRQHDKYAREQAVFRAKQMHYYCDICDAERFGSLLWGTGYAHHAEVVPELVFVCDGAAWIWNLVAFYYPQAIQIVDWYHAKDRLQRVAQAAFSAPDERHAWLEQTTTDLWEGRVESVCAACQHIAARCHEAQQAYTYFSHNAARMRYDQFRAADYLIGSGTVESACKQIVTQRLKRPGAQWSLEGAVRTAKARAAWLSGEWDLLCAQRAALPLAV